MSEKKYRTKSRPRIRPALIARTTAELWELLRNRPCMVVGNGPSRDTDEARATITRFATEHPGCVIACNGFWRTGLVPDEAMFCLVCGEAEQAEFALWDTGIERIVATRMAMPGQRKTRLIEACPWYAKMHRARIPHWTPRQWLWSTYSGELALQVAILAEPTKIYTVGLDSGVHTDEDGTARISALAGEPGYLGQVDRSPSPWPDGWHTPTIFSRSRNLIRTVVERSEELGIPVRRAVPGGTLDFIPIETPC